MFNFVVNGKAIPVRKKNLAHFDLFTKNNALLAEGSYEIKTPISDSGWLLFCRCAIYGVSGTIDMNNYSDMKKLSRELGYHGFDSEFERIEGSGAVEQLPDEELFSASIDDSRLLRAYLLLRELCEDQARTMEGIRAEMNELRQEMLATEQEKKQAIMRVTTLSNEVLQLRRELANAKVAEEQRVQSFRDELEHLKGCLTLMGYSPDLIVATPGKCTIEKTSETPAKQHFWECQTCRVPDALICDSCAEACHKGHRLQDVGLLSGTCDCGSAKHWMCNLRPPVCTFSITGEEYTPQKSYSCLTCGISGELRMCQACAAHCHAGHNVISTDVQKISCDCGAGHICHCNLTHDK